MRFQSLNIESCVQLKHKDSKNDWIGSCKYKMNNLEFSRLLTNLKIVSEI